MALKDEDCISGRVMDIPQALFIDIAMGILRGIAKGNTYAPIWVI